MTPGMNSPEPVSDSDLDTVSGGAWWPIPLKGKHLPPIVAVMDSYETVTAPNSNNDRAAMQIATYDQADTKRR
ncbi:MAG: hypothetical protein AAFP68_16370 [Pseudomonadota bacterium]